MDVRQLLLLAGDNSALAKKKVDRLSTESINDEPKISGDAVAAYLAKQKKFKEKIQAQEDAARKKRIQGRLDASLGKQTRKEKKVVEREKAQCGQFLPNDKRSEDAKQQNEKELKRQVKEKERKEAELKRREAKSKLDHKRKSKSPECPPVKKKVKSDKDASALKLQSKKVKEKEKIVKVNHENTHRKQKRRTADKFESSLTVLNETHRKQKHRTEDKFESSLTVLNETHRKEKHRTEEKFESSLTILNEKQNKNGKTTKEKNNKHVNNAAPSMSFTDLLKLAKTNASTSRISADGNLVKKIEKPKTFDEEHDIKKKSKSRDEFYEPPSKAKHVNGIDSNHNDKKKDKLLNSFSEKYCKEKSAKEVSKIDKTQKDKVQNDRHPSKHKHNEGSKQSDIRSNKHKHDIVQAKTSKMKDSVKENNYSDDSPPPVKRGLIAQTISTKKSGNIQPPGKISEVFKQVKPGKPSGIEMQCMNGGNRKQKMKRPAVRPAEDNMEDELDKEMRMLRKKRRLFELKRKTGNSNLNEEDIESECDDYDLSEEDESDDNFIDDSECPADVSKQIRSITGYDRRMYGDYDDDDDTQNMESSYSQIEKEEARSTRIAREEDRIEALKEAEELELEQAREQAREKERLKKKKR